MDDEEPLEVKAAKWDEIRLAWETYENGGASAFDWDYDSRDLMRKLTGDYAPEPDPEMLVLYERLPWTRTTYAYESGQRIGTCIVTPVPDGYEARWYKLPASVGLGQQNIPLAQLEFLFGGLYGKDQKLIRKLDD